MIETVLLAVSLSFDNLEDFTLTFSNRLRLDDGGFVFTDIQNQLNQTSGTVINNGADWGDWVKYSKNDVTTFITSSLDASLNNLINGPNQQITIDQSGLIGKSLIEGTTDQYSLNQVWLTSNILAFSDNGFETAKLALGNITIPGGGTKFGLVAEVVVGNLIAGNQLRISNDANNFVLDQNGAVLTDAIFKITSSLTHPNVIEISPTAGILIKNKLGTTVFNADVNGNLSIKSVISGTGTFTGIISSPQGNLGTLIIDSQGLKTTDNVNYLRGDGSLHWGPLTIGTDGNAVFSGNISANKITGTIVNNQIGNGAINDRTISSLNATKITAGVINGIQIYGSTISYGGSGINNPSVQMYGQDSIALIKANNGVQIFASGNISQNTVRSAMFLTSSSAALYCPGAPNDPLGENCTVFIGVGLNEIRMEGSLNLSYVSDIVTPSGNGINNSYAINVSGQGVRNFVFSRGILVDVN